MQQPDRWDQVRALLGLFWHMHVTLIRWRRAPVWLRLLMLYLSDHLRWTEAWTGPFAHRLRWQLRRLERWRRSASVPRTAVLHLAYKPLMLLVVLGAPLAFSMGRLPLPPVPLAAVVVPAGELLRAQLGTDLLQVFVLALVLPGGHQPPASSGRPAEATPNPLVLSVAPSAVSLPDLARDALSSAPSATRVVPSPMAASPSPAVTPALHPSVPPIVPIPSVPNALPVALPVAPSPSAQPTMPPVPTEPVLAVVPTEKAKGPVVAGPVATGTGSWFGTPTVPVEERPSAVPAPTATPMPSATPAATMTPTATPTPSATASTTPTVTPTPSATASTTPTVTPTPSATPTATPTTTPAPSATPSATPTPSLTPTLVASTLPVATPVPSPTPVVVLLPSIACSGAQVEVEASDAGGLTTLRVTVSGVRPMLLRAFEVRVGQNADELDDNETPPTVVFQTRSGGRVVAAATTIETTREDILVMLDRPLLVDGEGLEALVSYRHSRPISTADDSFDLWLAEEGLPICRQGGVFPALGAAEPDERLLSVNLITPGGQRLDSPDLARFEAVVSLPPEQIDRVTFTISEVEGAVVWRAVEHRSAFCAFGGNERCDAPPQDWWEWLPAGLYQIRVTAHARGGDTASVGQTFEKLAPAYPPPWGT
ncbi:MAG TPA: hypothetical protein VFS21_26015 [Roseiflexaceae bacterium]|nr:hypothetical protein [Roseiflexaceae bacterium]